MCALLTLLHGKCRATKICTVRAKSRCGDTINHRSCSCNYGVTSDKIKVDTPFQVLGYDRVYLATIIGDPWFNVGEGLFLYGGAILFVFIYCYNSC